MYIKSFQLSNYRGFGDNEKVDLNADITVLTGQNDVGKTSILDAIHHSLANIEVNDIDLNLTAAWQGKSIQHNIVIEFSNDIQKYLPGAHEIPQNSTVTITYNQGKKLKVTQAIHPNGSQVKLNSVNYSLTGVDVIFIKDVDKVRPNLYKSTVIENETETFFWNELLGKSDIESETVSRLNLIIKFGLKRLNNIIKEYFPNIQLKLEAVIIPRSEIVKETGINLFLTEGDNTSTPAIYRGAGIQKCLYLIAKLVSQQNHDKHTIILIDEPENSLHPDAQHSLRFILEKLARGSHIQIIYATHSPSMINSARPDTIRLVKRVKTKIDEYETIYISKIDNRPLHENYSAVRVSLGLIPQDGLLQGNINIFCEGNTDALCLSELMLNLKNEEDFNDIDSFLSMCHIISCGGSNISKWIEIGRHYSDSNIVFIDNDVEKDPTDNLVEMGSLKPEQIVKLEAGHSIENLVEESIYILAIQNYTQDKSVTLEEFQEYKSSKSTDKKPKTFNQMIDGWLLKKGLSISKPEVMKQAVQISIAEKHPIKMDKIKELARIIKKEFNKRINH